MGKIGRLACIFTPMALSIASLICLLLVFLGGLNKGSELQRDLYFFKVRSFVRRQLAVRDWRSGLY